MDRKRIVEGAAEFGKVTLPHFGRGHGNEWALAVAFAGSFVAEEEKCAVSAVIELGDYYGTPDGSAKEVSAVGSQLLAESALEVEVGVNGRVPQIFI